MNKGGVLFDEGINMLIFNSPNDDITDKIQLVCPTNHYSDKFFDEGKKTLIIYSKDGYYEPLCKIKKKKTAAAKYNITRFWSMRDFTVLSKHSNIINIIGKVKDLLLENCLAKKSLLEY